MCTARILFSHILNYSFVYSISHLLYGSFQLYYGWIWNVLHRLLSLISSPALLSRKMEGPWMKWVTGNGPWYWTAQPCFLSSLCSQWRWKQAAVTWSHYHRAHCSSFPLPSEHKTKHFPLLPRVASCQVFGLIDEKSNKNELLPVSVCFSLPQTLHHILLSVLWTASVSKGMCSPLRSPFCPAPPFRPITPTPSWSIFLFALFSVAHGQHCIVFPIADCDMRPMQHIITRITFVMEIRRTAQKMSENITRKVIVCEVLLQLHTQRVSGGEGYNNMGFLGYSQIKMLNTGVYTIIFVFPSKALLRKQGFVSHMQW